jgi:type I restriction enzyme S subunit
VSLNLDKSAWKRVSLGEVAAASREKVDPSGGSVERFVAGEHMDTDDLKIHRWGDPTEVDLGPAFHRRFRRGQVLYGSRRTYLRKVAVADFEGVCANTTFVVESRDEGVLLQEFLPFVMTSEPFHAFAIAESKGSVNPYVNWSDIERYEFDLPPLDEQKRIADLLWALEFHGRSLADSRSALDLGLSALIDSLFTASNAPESKIGDVLEVCQYGLSSRAGEEGRYPMLRMTNLRNGRVVGDDLKYCDLDSKDLDAYRLEPNDVLFNRTNSAEHVGHSGIFALAGDYVFASYLVRLRPWTNLVLPQFLNHFINSRLGQSRIRVHVSRGVDQANISASKLKTVMMPVPPLSEQSDLVDRIQSLSTRAEALTAEADALRAARSAVLATVFGGN